MSQSFYPVTDGKGQRVGDAYKRSDGTTCVRLERPITLPRPGAGYDSIVIYIDPVPSLVVGETSPLDER